MVTIKMITMMIKRMMICWGFGGYNYDDEDDEDNDEDEDDILGFWW